MRSTASRGSERVLSIRLSPDGLSFWMDGQKERFIPLHSGVGLHEAADICVEKSRYFERIHLLLDTPTVPVPSELFSPDEAHKYLTINNLYVGTRNEVVTAQIPPGVACVMVADSDALKVFRDMFGKRLTVSSAFEAALETGVSTIYLTGNQAYIAMRRESGALVYCDSLPYSTAADLVYYASRLSRFMPARTRVHIRGLGAHTATRALRKILRCTCE